MCDMQDMHNELQDVMGQSFGVPDDIDEDDLMGELDALEDELAQEAENPTASGVPSYLQVVITTLLWYKTYTDVQTCSCSAKLQILVSAFCLPQCLFLGPFLPLPVLGMWSLFVCPYSAVR